MTLNKKKTEQRGSWQGAAQKLTLAAETGNKGEIGDATKQTELALSMENQLDFERSKLK